MPGPYDPAWIHRRLREVACGAKSWPAWARSQPLTAEDAKRMTAQGNDEITRLRSEVEALRAEKAGFDALMAQEPETCPRCSSPIVSCDAVDDVLEYGAGPNPIRMPFKNIIYSCANGCDFRWENWQSEIVRDLVARLSEAESTIGALKHLVGEQTDQIGDLERLAVWAVRNGAEWYVPECCSDGQPILITTTDPCMAGTDTGLLAALRTAGRGGIEG